VSDSAGQHSGPPAGWYPDPVDAGRLLFFDGVRWTGDSATRPPVPAPPRGTLPMSVSVAAIAVTALPLVISRVTIYLLAGQRWPVVVYLAVAAVIAYLPGLLLWRYVARRFVAGHPIDAVGLRIRWVDLGWGPLTWLAAVVAEVVVGNLIVALKVPFVSNTDAFGDLHHRRGYVLALLLLAVVIAPVVEEIIFRGLLQRGLLSALPPWLAIAVQGLLFGAAHVSPERGMGNIGLALVLGAVGVVFGATAYLTRRLAPTMVAHAIVNAVAMAVVLSR
jgi:membrane protease YdiL (CAAX protease family)